MKKTNLRKSNGITLIALVITIIVLLILAGVAISMLSGENGILTKAAEAKTKTEEGQKQEETALESMELETYFQIENLKYKCSNGYITGIDNEEKAKNLKLALEKQGYKLYKKDQTTEVGNDEKLTIGMVVKKDTQKIATIIILGDVDGSGDINVLDTNAVQNALADGTPIRDYYKIAADIDGDGEITDLDATAITNALTGGNIINQYIYAKSPNKIEIYTTSDLEEKYSKSFADKLKGSKYKIEDGTWDEVKVSVLKGVSSTTKVGEILDVFADENVSIRDADNKVCGRDDVIENEYSVIYKYKDGRNIDVCYILNL